MLLLKFIITLQYLVLSKFVISTKQGEPPGNGGGGGEGVMVVGQRRIFQRTSGHTLIHLKAGKLSIINFFHSK